MRAFKIWAVCSCVFIFASTQVVAQEDSDTAVLKKDFKIQKYTIMERFESDFMISAEERADLKKKRIADAEHARNVLDTIDISDRKRRLLIRDLKYNPFSERLNKFIAETRFENEDVVDQQELP